MIRSRLDPSAARWAVLGALAIVLSACGASATPTPVPATTVPATTVPATTVPATAAPTPTTAPSSAAGGGIALLLPQNDTPRYETADKPFFEAELAAKCPTVAHSYSNAAADPAAQQTQAEAAINNGAKVLVLDPVDGGQAAAIVDEADAKGVKVISYDRLILGDSKPDYYISFDGVAVGKLQAQALIDKLTSMNLGHKPNVVMIDGSPTDNNATLFKTGAHSVLDTAANVVKEDAMPNWAESEAQGFMDGYITSLGKDGFDGVYAANDDGGLGAITSMQNAGIDPSTKPTTGQDATLAGVQRILAGTQFMTIYKAIKLQATAAADVACLLATGQSVPASMANGTTNNGVIDVPSVLLNPIAVTADGSTPGTVSVAASVVADQFYGADSVTQICTADFAAACTQYGVH